MPLLRDVVAVLDELYDPRLAQDWDAVGLVCGEPEATVAKVLFVVDPVAEVVDEAVSWGADLIVAHHPLFLRGVHSVAATTPKGRVVHTLVKNDVALHVCHTNADAASPGVSDALATTLGLIDTGPLDPHPLDPYPLDPELGIGRIGRLPEPEPLSAFVTRVARCLPSTEHGVRVAGDLARKVGRVAVSGGAGDSYLDRVREAGVDAYVTADLRHHPASEATEQLTVPALVDVAHWASEWPWLSDAASRLTRALAARDTTVETRVSRLRTDPWSLHLRTPEGGNSL